MTLSSTPRRTPPRTTSCTTAAPTVGAVGRPRAASAGSAGPFSALDAPAASGSRTRALVYRVRARSSRVQAQLLKLSPCCSTRQNQLMAWTCRVRRTGRVRATDGWNRVRASRERLPGQQGVVGNRQWVCCRKWQNACSARVRKVHESNPSAATHIVTGVAAGSSGCGRFRGPLLQGRSAGATHTLCALACMQKSYI